MAGKRGSSSLAALARRNDKSKKLKRSQQRLYSWTEEIMSISELLLQEFDAEAKSTRTMLERVPFDKSGFTPHQKSMPLEKLAPHVAELPGFGLTILTTPELDFSAGPPRTRPPFEAEGMMKFFDE